MDLPGQREFFKKLQDLDQKKLFGDLRTIWKTYQKIQHSLRHVLSITNDQLDFSISVGKGRADSSEIGLLDWLFHPKKKLGKNFPNVHVFFQSWKQKRQGVSPQPRSSQTSNLRIRQPCLWSLRNSLGLHGDNFIG